MGAGLAKQLANRYPDLPAAYGRICIEHGADTPVVAMGAFIMFPVKVLNVSAPHLSWQAPASMARIEQSTEQLAELEPALRDGGDVVLPMVGCGNGKLNRRDVYPILWRILKSDRFILCKTPETVAESKITNIFPAALKVPAVPPALEVGADEKDDDYYVDREYVMHKTTLGKTTIDTYEALGIFPRRRKLGPKKIAWVKSEIAEWCAKGKVSFP